MKVAVVGGGNGALAVAAEWGLAGHEVRMVESPNHHRGLEGVESARTVTAEGRLTGTAPVLSAGTDAAECLQDAELVLVVGPAFATEPLAGFLAPHLRDGMTVVVCPGSCLGAVAFANAAGIPLDGSGITVAETSTLPYAARVTAPATVRIFHKLAGALFVGALGEGRSTDVTALLQPVWPEATAATSVWQSTMQNGNPVIHPAVTLLNAGLIDRTGGDFMFYEEGVTPAVGRLMEAVDRERIAIGEALGVIVLSEPETGVAQGYMLEDNYTTGYSTAPGFLGIKAQSSLDNRYLTEDVGVTLVFFTDVARAVGVATPVMDALITITSQVLGTDYRAQPSRTLASLGLGDRDAEGLRRL